MRLPVLACLMMLSPSALLAQGAAVLSDRVGALSAGLFCAPPEGDRRPAPGTMAGWVHVPDEPVRMIAQGQVAPAVLGMGFGVRYSLRGEGQVAMRYQVTHPPMPPTGIARQTWEGTATGGAEDTVFFQFDIPEELQPGLWTFSATADGEVLFEVRFDVRPAADLPTLAALCQGGGLLSFIPTARAAAG